MKRTMSLGMALAVFAAGALVGQLATSNSRAQASGKASESSQVVDLTQETSVTLGYLNALRKGQTTEAIALMENHLDSHIVKLGESLSAVPPAERNAQSLKVISEFRDYRAKYPHPVRSPAMSNGLEKAYKLVDTSAK